MSLILARKKIGGLKMKNIRLIAIILILTLSLSLLTACNNQENKENPGVVDLEETNSLDETPVEVKEQYGITIAEDTVSFIDGRGEEVTINKNPERVVVIYNSFFRYLDEEWWKNSRSY